MTTYNSAGLLQRCLQSLYAQTHRPLELIIVDNVFFLRYGAYIHLIAMFNRRWRRRTEQLRRSDGWKNEKSTVYRPRWMVPAPDGSSGCRTQGHNRSCYSVRQRRS
jgi:hypothetical protein